jgi:hypothetical protein
MPWYLTCPVGGHRAIAIIGVYFSRLFPSILPLFTPPKRVFLGPKGPYADGIRAWLDMRQLLGAKMSDPTLSIGSDAVFPAHP